MIEYIIKVRELIKDESNWTKEWYAKTASGGYVYADSPNATRFCLMGAIHKVVPKENYGQVYEYIRSTLKRYMKKKI